MIITTLVLTVSGPSSNEKFHYMASVLQNALMDLEECNDDVDDATVSSDSGQQRFEVELLVHRDDPLEALELSMGVVRTALHAAGANTPTWPTVLHVAESRTEPVPG